MRKNEANKGYETWKAVMNELFFVNDDHSMHDAKKLSSQPQFMT